MMVQPSCSCNNIVVSARCKQLLAGARRERDNAIMLARGYRDNAEECQTEKRKLKPKKKLNLSVTFGEIKWWKVAVDLD